jgi:uncharacterized protein
VKGKNVAFSFLIGLAGGTVFYVAHLPLPWILGPAFATMVMNTVRPGKVEWPRWLGDAGIIVVAFLLGRTMTLEMAKTMLFNLPGMVSAGVLWLAVCFIIGLLFARLVRLSPLDGVLGCVPGGLSQMVLIAEDMKGADPGNVAIIQTARLVIVLYTVPFLATVWALMGMGPQAPAAPIVPPEGIATAGGLSGIIGYLALPLIPLSAWLSRKLKIPAGEFMGPFFLTGALAIAGLAWPSVPAPTLSFAQVLIGVFIGKRVQPRIMWTNKRLGPIALISGAFLVVITAVASLMLSLWTADSMVTWFLALAPGGLGEVAVTALVLGADVQQVTAYQLFRLIVVLVVAPPMLKLIMARWGESKPKERSV